MKPLTKICSNCKIEKEVNKNNFQFRSDSNTWRGTCRVCKSEYDGKYFLDNQVDRLRHGK